MKIDEAMIKRTVLTELARGGLAKYIPVGISARHVHLSKEHIEALFGEGYELNPIKDLTQPGQYAAREQVTVVGPGGRLERVRVLGPARGATQVEISVSDSFVLGAKNTPVRLSGNIANTPGVKLLGPCGSVETEEGLMVAARHIHMSYDQALAFGTHDGQVVSVKVYGDRECVLENVICRVGDGHTLELHLDTDEANACGLSNGDIVELVIPGGDRLEDHVNIQEDQRPQIAPSMRSGNAPLPKPWLEKTPALKHEFVPVEECTKAEGISEDEILELVTEADINDAYRDNRTKVYCEKKALITPSAKDRAVAAGIKIIRLKGGGV